MFPRCHEGQRLHIEMGAGLLNAAAACAGIDALVLKYQIT
jgi:hypothetical protein